MTTAIRIPIEVQSAAQADGSLYLARVQGGRSRPLLLLHGSTIPASTAYCTVFGGASFLELLAENGFDAWCLDFRGYGRSYKPDGTAGPVCSTEDAVSDLITAVDHITRVTGSRQIDILGWSWGATVAGAYAAEKPERLHRLILLSPQWLRASKPPFADNPAIMEAGYRSVAPDVICDRWLETVEKSRAAEIKRNGWDEALTRALANEVNGAGSAPNGPMVEIASRWSSGSPVYAPKEIDVPVRVLVGSDDAETPPDLVRALYAELEGHPDAVYWEIEGATHFIPFEPQRAELIRQITEFLPPGS